MSVKRASEQPHLDRARDAALRLAARISRRPLLGSTLHFDVSAPPAGAAVELPRISDVDGTEPASVGWWAGELPDGSDPQEAAEKGTLERVDGDGTPAGSPAPYRVWPPAGGWPPTARRLRVSVAQAVVPNDEPDLKQAVLVLCRVFYMGKATMTADERRGLELMLPGVDRWLRQ